MTVIVKRADWDLQAQAWLAPAMIDDPYYGVKDLAHDVKNNHVALFNVYDLEDDHIASFICRLDDCGTSKELIVVAAGGYYADASLYKTITPFVEKIATQCGAGTLRGHTKKKTIGRLMERAGWQQSEFIYRREIGGANGR